MSLLASGGQVSAQIASGAGSSAGQAGTGAAAEFRLVEPWRWVTFDESSGLPAAAVIDIVEPEGGVPWALTENGLAHFDGYRWKPLAAEAGLPPRAPTALAPDPSGQLLLVADGRLFRGDSDGFEPVVIHGPAAGERVHGVVALDADTLLLRTDTKVWSLVDGGWSAEVDAPWSEAMRIYRLIDAGGFVWVVGRDGAFLWDGDGWSTLRQPGRARRVRFGDQLVAAGIVGNGPMLGLFESGRVRSFDPARPGSAWSAPLVVPQPLRAALAIARRPNGDLWVAAADGLHLFRASSRLWTQWAGAEASRRNSILALLETDDGSLWIGSEDGVEVRHPDGSIEHWAEVGGTPLGSVTGLAEEADGAVWMTSAYSFEGAFRWDGTRWRRFFGPGAVGQERIFRVRSDPAGRPWFAVGAGPGVLRFAGDELRPWAPAGDLENRSVYDVAFGPAGSIWVVTDMGPALWSNGRWRTWSVQDGLRSPDTWILCVDARGRPWFSDGLNGLGTVDDGALRYVTVEQGLVSNAVRDLAVHEDGGIWVATERGLSVLQGDEWNQLDGRSGLATVHLEGVEAGVRRIYVGTSGAGVQVLDLEELPTEPPSLSVGESISDDGTVVLSWRADAHWGFEYPGPIQTRYRFGGSEWSGWQQRSGVRLEGVGAGSHPYSIEARNGLGAGPVSRATGTVEVPWPLYRRPPVLLPAVLVLLGVATGGLIAVRRKRRFDREIRDNEARLQLILRQMPASLWVTDRDLYIQSVQGAFYKEVGLSKDALIGSRVFDFVDDPETIAMMEDAYSRVLEGASAAFPLEFADRQLQVHLDPLSDERGEIVGVLGLAFDVTERQQMEEQLLQSRKLEAIGTLAGGVAHDFNNLLVAINGYAELVLEDLDEEHPARADVGEIVAAGDRAADLVAQLLAFGRRQVRDPRRLDLNHVLAETENMLRRLIGEDIDLVTDMESRDMWVLMDRSQLEQVIVNLAVNARDAMPDGGTLSLFTRSVHVDESEAALAETGAGTYAMLEVRDTGVGIDPGQLDRVFEPFFTTKGPSGTGLGLATVYGVVQQSDGWIDVDSEPEKGTTFRVCLPLVEAEQEAGAEEATEEATDTEGPADVEDMDRRPARNGVRLLVVEDDTRILEVINRFLEGSGYIVHERTDPRSALEFCGRCDGQIDLLITDVVMPGMDGIELARRVRERIPGCKVLFMSGYSERRLPDLGSRTDMDFLQKPFTPSTLAQRIEALL